MFEDVEALGREMGDVRTADMAGLLAESLSYLQGRPQEAMPVNDALLASLPDTHAFVPWLLRNRGYALAQLGEFGSPPRLRLRVSPRSLHGCKPRHRLRAGGLPSVWSVRRSVGRPDPERTGRTERAARDRRCSRCSASCFCLASPSEPPGEPGGSEAAT